MGVQSARPQTTNWGQEFESLRARQIATIQNKTANLSLVVRVPNTWTERFCGLLKPAGPDAVG